MITKTIKLSLCECGFPLLRETVPLGTEYEINTDHWQSYTLICGGCKKKITGMAVLTSSGTFLPSEIFDLTPDAQVFSA